jgi:hypothetical protein
MWKLERRPINKNQWVALSLITAFISLNLVFVKNFVTMLCCIGFQVQKAPDLF